MEVHLPRYRDHDERDPEERGRPDWREKIASWMYWHARHKHQEQRRERRDDGGRGTDNAGETHERIPLEDHQQIRDLRIGRGLLRRLWPLAHPPRR